MSVRLRPTIAAVPDYDPRDLSDDGIAIRLHRNEGALPPPEFVLDAIRSIDAETLRTYPTALQRDVTTRLAARFGRNPDDVVLCQRRRRNARDLRAHRTRSRRRRSVRDTDLRDVRARCCTRRRPTAPRAVHDTLAFRCSGVARCSRRAHAPRDPRAPQQSDDRPAARRRSRDHRPRTAKRADPCRRSLPGILRSFAGAQRERRSTMLSSSAHSRSPLRSPAHASATRWLRRRSRPRCGERSGHTRSVRLAWLRRRPICATHRARDPTKRSSKPKSRAASTHSRRAFAPFAREIWRGPANFLLIDCGARAERAARRACRARHRRAHVR